MATDARGHTVPASTDHPSRSELTALSLSILDIVPVADTTARAAAATALSPTTSKPLVVARADAASELLLEVTTDGSTWLAIPLCTGMQDYTPTLTSTGTAPGMGTGATAAGRWEQTGRRVQGEGEIVAGSTGFTAGTGAYRILLPAACTAAAYTAGRIVGYGAMYDASAADFVCTFMLVASTATTATMIFTGGVVLGATAPVVPANLDQWRFSFDYEAAA